MGGGSRLAVLGPVLACPGVVGGCGDAVLACSLSSYGCGVWAPCGILYCVRCLLLVPGGYRYHLVLLAWLETTGRRTGGGAAGCLAIVTGLVMTCRLMYIMNMIYAMYIKDTRIQEYENMMDIWGDVDGMIATLRATLGDETGANKTR